MRNWTGILLLLSIVFNHAKMSYAQRVSVDYFDFNVTVRIDGKEPEDFGSLNLSLRRINSGENHFSKFSAQGELLRRGDTTTLYSIEVKWNNSNLIAIYILIDSKRAYFFDDLMKKNRLGIGANYLEREVIFNVTSFLQKGTYFIDLYDMKKPLHVDLSEKIKNYNSGELPKSHETICELIEPWYKITRELHPNLKGNTILTISQKGMEANKISDLPISTETLEKYIQQPKLGKPMTVAKILNSIFE
ncbi:MAG: hypothetical protein H6582_14370 [Crocinitomicaceae bacterium]|nr:hypothetical protein [Flavobacteriales bacterium]MCB9225360.1 hypothetical protein [Crocinitomicaceae bacterium]